MTERQAWLTIAKAYATPRGERTKKQNNLTEHGICNAIAILLSFDVASYKMETKILESMPPKRSGHHLGAGYFCPSRFHVHTGWESCNVKQCDEWRADYCYAMYYSNGAE